jgi:tripartite ATP-independent transporter DctM subunit
MVWWMSLLFLVGGVLSFFAIGLPVAFAFLLIDIIGIMVFMGGLGNLPQLVLSIYNSLSTFVLAPVPLFILMGQIMFHSGMAYKAMDVIEIWLGKIPGRLSYLAIGGGTVFASLSGSSMASAAMMGSTLVPEMQSRGYSKEMTLGPILGSGGIAIMIPPSSLGVVLGSLAFIPIGKLLIGGIIPGILLALLYTLYLIYRFKKNPELAPVYEIKQRPLSERLIEFMKYVLPLGTIIFLVIGLIVLGVATPSESAAMGALGSFVLAALYGKINLKIIKKSIMQTFNTSVMVLIIISGASAFSQLLSFSGAARGLVNFVLGLEMAPMSVLIAMLLTLLVLGCFMEQTSMIMITVPIFMPLVHALGFDIIWFGILMLLTLEMAATSPPFGLVLFVMKGVAPKNTTMGDIYKAALPYLTCDLIAMILLIVFPALALYLPSLIN